MIRSLLMAAASIALASCGTSPTAEAPSMTETSAPIAPATPTIDAAAEAAAIKELEGWDSIIEVMHDEDLAVQWVMGVKDDGSKRYGLAESVCMELNSRGLQHEDTIVRIVDRATVMSNGGDFRAASLGTVKCSTGDWIEP